MLFNSNGYFINLPLAPSETKQRLLWRFDMNKTHGIWKTTLDQLWENYGKTWFLNQTTTLHVRRQDIISFFFTIVREKLRNHHIMHKMNTPWQRSLCSTHLEDSKGPVFYWKGIPCTSVRSRPDQDHFVSHPAGLWQTPD